MRSQRTRMDETLPVQSHDIHGLCNQWVAGSIPVAGSRIFAGQTSFFRLTCFSFEPKHLFGKSDKTR